MSQSTMLAVVFDGPYKVSVQERPIPKGTAAKLMSPLLPSPLQPYPPPFPLPLAFGRALHSMTQEKEKKKKGRRVRLRMRILVADLRVCGYS